MVCTMAKRVSTGLRPWFPNLRIAYIRFMQSHLRVRLLFFPFWRDFGAVSSRSVPWSCLFAPSASAVPFRPFSACCCRTAPFVCRHRAPSRNRPRGPHRLCGSCANRFCRIGYRLLRGIALSIVPFPPDGRKGIFFEGGRREGGVPWRKTGKDGADGGDGYPFLKATKWTIGKKRLSHDPLFCIGDYRPNELM